MEHTGHSTLPNPQGRPEVLMPSRLEVAPLTGLARVSICPPSLGQNDFYDQQLRVEEEVCLGSHLMVRVLGEADEASIGRK